MHVRSLRGRLSTAQVSRPCDYDIAVVGAGAAGLTAAIFAKRAAPTARIVLLDGAPKIGAKILISGGGRCNVTHHAVVAEDFNGNRNAIARVLRTFPVAETVSWFAEMGVTLEREETGKLFPATNRARTVVEALLRACEGVEVRTGCRVVSCERVLRSAEREHAIDVSKKLAMFMRSRWALSAHSSEAAPPPSSGLRPPSPPKKRGEKGLDW
jgi:predicted flavoprotein YhiN